MLIYRSGGCIRILFTAGKVRKLSRRSRLRIFGCRIAETGRIFSNRLTFALFTQWVIYLIGKNHEGVFDAYRVSDIYIYHL